MHSPNHSRRKWLSDVVRLNDCSINFHLSKLSIAKFSILYDISLVRDWKRKLRLITLGSERVKNSPRSFVESLLMYSFHHTSRFLFAANSWIVKTVLWNCAGIPETQRLLDCIVDFPTYLGCRIIKLKVRTEIHTVLTPTRVWHQPLYYLEKLPACCIEVICSVENLADNIWIDPEKKKYIPFFSWNSQHQLPRIYINGDKWAIKTKARPLFWKRCWKV